ncbi:hypothetical protein LTR36_007080 [Oleoguttula mirabilis]|uniref:Serine-threonine protein kinase 19-domain-containing protein n=1 Tax=Oleoguttula mirabilis TaxID=1507867 RepID=A0AAV9JB64_9PEZI|nr:hypothetical protein LTR36_007080 [Oleoguttula mirabilis]
MPKTTNPLLRRKSSSPFATLQRKKPGSRKSSLAEKEDASERLDDTGLTPSLAPEGIRQDVVSLIRHIQQTTWEDVPDRAAGMGSERISEVLRFRKGLPRIVSVAHLHALSVSTTQTERELSRLVAQGVVRKLTIPGRGKGGAAVGEGVVLVEDWKTNIRSGESGVDEELADKYILLMNTHPTSPTTPTTALTSDDIRQLVTLGYLTSPSALSSAPGNLFAAPGTTSLLNISTAGTKAATGTLAAIGGRGAIHESGGGGSALATRDNRPSYSHSSQTEMTFSLPGTGAYLKLLTEARLHLVFLLKQLSPRHKEATRDLLREKWEGNTLNDAASRLKRARGEWNGVLPGKTKKWREFYGMEFAAILAECVGSGVVELFETGSVGAGVRAR